MNDTASVKRVWSGPIMLGIEWSRGNLSKVASLWLSDGEAVVSDNQRTLHGQSAFSSLKHPRQLRGCYLARDGVHSEAAVLRRELHGEEVS